MMIKSRFLALLAACTFVLAACDSDNNNNSTLGVPGGGNNNTMGVAAASIEGPIAGSPVIVSTFFDLGAQGFMQEEYFIWGTATQYVNANELGSNGRWQVQAAEQADYKTRVIVIRPIDSANFNGTVVVEWLNVSAGFDSAPDYGMLHTEFLREGYAWVGISAQKVGVDALLDGTAAAIVPGTVFDDRYDSLMHPGDGYSYDIYAQFAQALRTPGDIDVLGDLDPDYIIAAGESQSAGRLMTYVNAFAPMHAVHDGYFIHSRTAGSAPLQGGFFDATVPTPDIVRVRNDLGTPVLMLQTETDLFVLGSYPDNQEDSSRFRLWEVAGTAHADLYTFLDNRFDVGTDPSVAAVVEERFPVPGLIECPVPVNAGPQHWVAKAGIHALNEWVVNGIAPPRANRLSVSGEPPAFDLDENGNVIGGIRTAYVDVPIAKLSGEGQPPLELDPDNPDLDIENVDFCFLSGTTELFDAATLGSLYASNASYIEAVNNATDDAVEKGFLRPADGQLIKDYAASSDIFAQ